MFWKKKTVIRQYGTLPFRRTAEGSVEILLVTSRESRRWVIPRGNPIGRLSPHRSAEQEAFEEAGVSGNLGKTAIGSYTYAKRLRNGRSRPTEVFVFPLKVKNEAQEWPEREERERRWFDPADAAEAVEEPGLKALLRGFRNE